MKISVSVLCSLAAIAGAAVAMAEPLGLPPVPVPADNLITPAKIQLGEKLFNDKRFSSTGQVSCSHCHEREKGFTDGPLKTSEGINKLVGTRNAPTIANAAYFARLFWDGRAQDLEDQSQHPFLNPIEMGLSTHDTIVQIVRTDPDYIAMMQKAFGKAPGEVGMTEVKQAIATFERTLVFGDSPFDRWYFGGQKNAMSEAAQRGFTVFREDGRCVSCHTIEQNFALFTDNRFHNIGVGITRIQDEVPKLAPEFLAAKARGADVDKAVLSNRNTSELGRFAVTDTLDDIGAFKTPTLRNVAVTAPYMHDGSLATLKDVVDHYNNGGITVKTDRVNDYLSGGIRPLHLTEQQITDLVAFMEALTSPQFEALQAKKAGLDPDACSRSLKMARMAAAADSTKRITP